MDDDLEKKLASAVGSATADTDPEAEWTKAAVALRLLGRTAAPSKIGRFAVLRFVGAGGMGRVFLAYDERLQRELAIKLLAGQRSKAAAERLLKEARALARLSHPNVVQVYEVGMHGDDPFIAMEFLRGSTLRHWQTESSTQPRHILDAYLQAGAGLHAAHKQGLVHRDFKPENVFVQAEPGVIRVRVIDFGLAKLDSAVTTTPAEVPSGQTTSVTRSGAILGTPMYMAPEQLRGEAGSAYSDQFSFCVALAEALWGVHPFSADSIGGLRSAHQRPPILPKRSTSDLPWLRPVLMRGMATKPEDRFPSMRGLLDALAHDPIKRRRQVLALGGGAAVVVLLGLAAGKLSGSEPPCTGAEQAFEDVWSDGRRASLEAAFHALEASHGAQTWSRISPEFDDFADRWMQGHQDACLAASVRHDQSFDVMDRRMACLDRARQVFDATARTLEDRTAEVLDRADDVAAGLPDLDACASVSRLGSEDRSPPTSQANIVNRGRMLVAEANALRLAGRVELSLEKAEQAEAEIRGLGFLPIEAEVQLALGRTLNDAGRPEPAVLALSAAHEAAARAELTALRRDAVAERYSLEAKRGNFDVCDALGPGLQGSSKQPEEVADAHVRRAAMLHLRGRSSEATGGFREALALLEGLDDPLAVARARDGLTSSLTAQARFAEATATGQRVIETLTKHLGSHHPRTAEAHASLADTLRQAGNYDEAEVEAKRALELTLSVRPPGHPDIPAARRTLGSLLLAAGKNEQALAALQQSVQETEAAFGSDDIATASAYNNLAGPLVSMDRMEEALAALRASVRIKASVLGEEHPSTARTRDNIGGLLRMQGLFDEARVEHEAALEARVASLGNDHPQVAISHSNIGALFQFQGDIAAAEKKYAEAVRIAIVSEGPSHPDVAHYKVNRARMLLELGRPQEAVPLLRSALEIRSAKLDPESNALLDTRNALGRALCNAGERGEGREQLEGSLAVPPSTDRTALVRYEAAFELAKCARQDGDTTRARTAAALALEVAATDGPKGRAFSETVQAWVEEDD